MVDPIARGPVLANPESLDLPECREALRCANAQLLKQAEHMQAMQSVLQGLGNDMARLVVAHRDHDAVLVHQLLSEITRQHVIFKREDGVPAGPTSSTVH